MWYRVEMWSFEKPIRTSNGVVFTSVAAGRDVKEIQVSDSGLVRITPNGNSRPVLVFGSSFGYEIPSEPEETPAEGLARLQAQYGRKK